MGSGNDNWNWENGHGNSWDVFEPDRTNPDPHASGSGGGPNLGGGGGCAVLLAVMAAGPAVVWAGNLFWGT
jgi:hypothetical protein